MQKAYFNILTIADGRVLNTEVEWYDKLTMPYLSSVKTSANKICDLVGADAYIAYVTSTREPAEAFGGAVAPDSLAHFADQLKTIGKKKEVSTYA